MRRILIVDDSIDSALALAKLIELAGYETQVASSGAEAMEVFHRFKPQVALLDLGMPDIDGFEICRRIRQLPEAASVLIVIVSGYLQDEVRVKAMEAGANYYLTKPADAGLLLRSLGLQGGLGPPLVHPRGDLAQHAIKRLTLPRIEILQDPFKVFAPLRLSISIQRFAARCGRQRQPVVVIACLLALDQLGRHQAAHRAADLGPVDLECQANLHRCRGASVPKPRPHIKPRTSEERCRRFPWPLRLSDPAAGAL